MALSTLTAFFEKPWTKIVSSYLLVLALGIGLGVWGTLRWQTPPAPVVRTVENTKYVEVPVDKIVTKDVIKYVQDQAQVKKLLTEQAANKAEIKTLTETIAKLQSTTTLPSTSTVFVETPGSPEAHFKDWRLTFDATKTGTTYSLDQRFEALTAIGKDKDGKPLATTKLFEIGPGEVRTPLTGAQTTVVTAVPNPKRWFVSGAIQAGFGYSYDVKAKKGVSGGLVGLQWLKRGYSKSAEDGIYSLLTPAAYISTGTVEFGLLPVSVNLGRLPKQPFKDLWLSPLVVFGQAPNISPTRLGVVLTATF